MYAPDMLRHVGQAERREKGVAQGAVRGGAGFLPESKPRFSIRPMLA